MSHEDTAPALTALAEDETLLRDSVAEFAEAQIRPHVREMDEQAKMPKELVKQLFDLGVMGIEIPDQYGGGGAKFFHAVLAVEALSAVDPSVGVLVDVQNTLVINAIIRWGSDDVKSRYLPRLASNTVGAYALSEAGSGSDAFAMAARAVADGDHYVIDGRKLWITNGNEADIFIVFANVNPDAGYRGITAFMVERGAPGFTVGKKEDKLGIRASSTCELIPEGCCVPKANILGEVGKGYKVAIETLNEGRIGIGAQMIGIARAALDYSAKYVQTRVQFGKPISEFQAIQHELARMDMEIECARLAVYNAARLKEAGLPFQREGAIAKLKGSEVAEWCTSRGLELLGGYGYVKDYPLEKMYRDAKIGKIYEGTSFMQLNTIAKDVLKRDVR